MVKAAPSTIDKADSVMTSEEADIAELREINEGLRGRVERIEGENNDLYTRLRSSLTENDGLKEENKWLRSIIDALINRVD